MERIDHGVNCLEDEALVQRLKASAVGLTACPISNSYVTGSLKAREIKVMLDRSLLVTINSDDPAYFPGYMNENLSAVTDAANLTGQQIVQAVRNAFTIAWLPDTDRAQYLEDLAAYTAGKA